MYQYSIQDSWIPPRSLWLILDFSNLTTKDQYREVHNILKYLPDNQIEMSVLRQFYILKYEKNYESIGNGVFKESPLIPVPKIMKKAKRNMFKK
mgnify:CR=1 FL=1